MWTTHPNFQEIVRQVWSDEIPGTRQFALCRKLKALKYPLKLLNRKEFGHISERAEAARVELEDAQHHFHDSAATATAWDKVDRAKARVRFLDNAERSFYYQKAKCQSIRDGD